MLAVTCRRRCFGLSIRAAWVPMLALVLLSGACASAEPPAQPGLELDLRDVPLVTASTVRAVLDAYGQTRAPIVRPTSGTRHGHPLLIDRSLFAAIRAADPASGLKPIVRAHASPAGDLEIADEGAFIDIDTQEEYDRLVSDRFDDGADDLGRGRADV